MSMSRRIIHRPVAALRPLGRPLRHPCLPPFALAQGLASPYALRRWQTAPAAEVQNGVPDDKVHGHISVGKNETVVFFDHLFPLKLNYILRGPWRIDTNLVQFESSSLGITNPLHVINRATADLPVTITEIVPRVKDGGAFVKFSCKEGAKPAEVEAQLIKALQEKPLKPWFNPFARINASLVRGIPWLEDLNRFPKSRVRIEFLPREPGEAATELYQETLYSIFRHYGKIAEITSQPPDSKVTPRYAHVDFVLVRDAIMARNCLHGFVVREGLGGGKEGTRLRISYEQRIKAHSIWTWITSHPRLVLPVLAALVAAVTVAVFDPMRKFFVKAYVKHRTVLSSSRIFGWIKSQTDTLLGGRKKDKKSGLAAFWDQREGIVDSIRGGLADPSGTFIVVQGSRASGRDELVEQALRGRRHVLTIDCKPIVEASGESGAMRRLAASVGYRPIFSWANSVSSMLDLAVQSTTGVKSGFSETFEAQISKILHTAASALKEVSLSDRRDSDPDSEEVFLEAHPDSRTVVVIDNFLHKNEESRTGSHVIYEKMAEWAATLVQSSAAHVVFLTHDGSYSKLLSRALPDRALRVVPLGDVPPDVAKKYILSRLQEDAAEKKSRKDKEKDKDKDKEEGDSSSVSSPADKNAMPDLAELTQSIETIGGRLADLEIFATRLKTGQTPTQAVDEIVSQSAAEIVKNFIIAAQDHNASSSSSSSSDGGGVTKKKFSVEQAWWLIKTIAERRTLPYDEALLHPALSAGPTPAAAALDALASAELIYFSSRRGFPVGIHAGKPIYQAAFSLLARDAALRSRMDRAVLAALAKGEKAKLDAVERELGVLAGLPNVGGKAAGGRVGYLLEKLGDSQRRIVEFEGEMERLKKKGAARGRREADREEGRGRWWTLGLF